MRRRRWRTAVLWMGWTTCVFIAVAFVASGWWLFAMQVSDSLYGPCVLLHNGSMEIDLDDPFANWVQLERIKADALGLWRWNDWYNPTKLVTLPLYAVFLVVALPTLLVWRFVPKFPRGHCRRCGYNLTGLTEARCPECGVRFEGPMSTRT